MLVASLILGSGVRQRRPGVPLIVPMIGV